MRRIFLLATLMFVMLVSCNKSKDSVVKHTPVDYVNPYMGNISHLLVPTYPTVHLPNSMLRIIPERGDYTGDRLNGLAVATTSHRGSSAFNLSPYQGSGDDIKPIYQLSYDNEIIKPYTYSLYLDELNAQVDYALSHRAGIYKIDFDKGGDKYIVLNNNNGKIKVTSEGVSGYQTIAYSNETKQSTNIYIYLEADKKITNSGILKSGKITSDTEAEGKGACAVLQFSEADSSVSVKYGISFISEEQAKLNLENEIADFDITAVKANGRDIWNEKLNKIDVEGGTYDDKAVFYTSLYRTYERPVCISEGGRYFSAFDGKVHDDNGTPFYTDDWIWDTYRATHPLRVLIEKDLELDVIKSFLRMSKQMPKLWMPTFPEVTGDSRRMNSNHGVATVLDAYVKGLTDFDLNEAYLACKQGITEKTLAPWSGKPAGDLDEFFVEHGYFPALRPDQKEYSNLVHEFEKRQPVAVTLGTAYDEWCLSEIARLLNKTSDEDYFLKRSYDYRNLFNPQTHFFHPKDDQGDFIEPFDYRYSGGQGAREYYGENNGWVYRWDVPHNPADLINLMGGRENFINNLDQTFNEPLGESKYSFYSQLPDHTGNVGQFSMANEPSLHIPYLYNYAGQPWKTQKRVKKLIREWFRNDLMGVPGDEDGGGMSAFVVFSQLGFYPVTPGMPCYNIGTPFFEYAKIDMDGKLFEIKAHNLSEQNKYIQSAKLNGKEWNKPWFSQDDIKNGGTLELFMGNKANKEWGADIQDAPPSAVSLN